MCREREDEDETFPASQKRTTKQLCIVVRRDVPRFLGKQTLTMSSVIPRWQSHLDTVIARQRLGLRLLVPILSQGIARVSSNPHSHSIGQLEKAAKQDLFYRLCPLVPQRTALLGCCPLLPFRK